MIIYILPDADQFKYAQAWDQLRTSLALTSQSAHLIKAIANTSLLNQCPCHCQPLTLTQCNNNHPSGPLLISTLLAADQYRQR